MVTQLTSVHFSFAAVGDGITAGPSVHLEQVCLQVVEAFSLLQSHDLRSST